MGPKGEPTDYTESQHGRGHGTYMVATGVTYGMMRGEGWGLAIKAATARKNLSDAAVTLGKRVGPNVWFPWPHGVALVFHEVPEWARYAKKYPGVDDPGKAIVKRVWPEYFEGTVKAPPPKLRAGDSVRVVERLSKGLTPGTVLEVTRITPSMIWTEDRWKFPQSFYSEGKIVKVGASASRVASRYLQGDTTFTSAIGDLG